MMEVKNIQAAKIFHIPFSVDLKNKTPEEIWNCGCFSKEKFKLVASGKASPNHKQPKFNGFS